MSTETSISGPTNPHKAVWLALDIGGANLKAATSDGFARTVPFELWKRPDDLCRQVAELAQAIPGEPPDRVALTMTAELCDCYPTRSAGVLAVLAAVEAALPGRRIRIWGTDEQFHSPAEIRTRPLVAAAANWLAYGRLAARLIPRGPGLVIDVGSTTTDLIPTLDGVSLPRGRTDTERLASGELVYAGVIRTPVCALAPEISWRGGKIFLAAEFFASTLDVYLTLEKRPEESANRSTADGGPRTIEAARNRLARMIGADRDGFSPQDSVQLSLALHQVLLDRLAAAANRVCHASGSPQSAVVAGAGEFLAREVGERVLVPGGTIIELEQAWGPEASNAACAHALAVLAVERQEELDARASP